LINEREREREGERGVGGWEKLGRLMFCSVVPSVFLVYGEARER
jgi:hypothetical protein